MLRVHERFTFDDLGQLDPTTGIRQDVNQVVTNVQETTDKAKQTIATAGVTIENVGVAIGAAAAGAIVIFGSAMLPSDLKGSSYYKLAGIVLGAGIALGGAAYAFEPKTTAALKPADPGVVPGAKNLYVAPNIVVAADQGWKIFGTPRVDLSVTNRTALPLTLAVHAFDYIGLVPSPNLLEMTWNPETLVVAGNGSETKSFYFVTDKIKSAPGPRTVVFRIIDMSTGTELLTWSKTVNFT